MRKFLALAMVAGLVFIFSDRAIADDASECEALVKKAAAMCKERGVKATLLAIDDPSGPFVKGEVYVFALSLSMNAMDAHPHDKSIKRLPMGNISDSNGQKFFQKFKEVAESQGSGWVEYTWVKPNESQPSRKRSFVMRVPDEDLYVGAGYYVK
ncbi:MAG TPA: cache domain-containing protein [Desulfomonilaceae bacterium]|nr:cache domain-containing protein [Desulfomonilaceae bacterium]